MLLTQEQDMIRDTIRGFAQAQIAPYAAAWDKTHAFPRAALKGLAELGVLGLVVPEAWDGAGLGYLELALALEEIAAADGATSTIVSVQNSLVGTILLHYGSPALKEQWLKPLARGEKLGCFALSEPQAGSDAGAITSRAEKVGEQWVLNGVKQFVTTGQEGDVAIVFAVTDKRAGKQGISCFLVPTGRPDYRPGYLVARLEDKIGQRASDTAQIVFENCRIPAANLLGAPGDGYRIALANLEGGRIGIAAQAVGMARAALESAVRYAKERTAFGKTLGEHQAIAFLLAEMATRIDVARQAVWHAASLRDAGRPCLQEASQAKLFASQMAEQVCSDAIQIHGGYGVTSDFPVERIYRDVRVCQIYEGSSEIQKMLIARALLA